MFHIRPLSWAPHSSLALLGLKKKKKNLHRIQTPETAHTCSQHAPGPSLAVFIMTVTILPSMNPLLSLSFCLPVRNVGTFSFPISPIVSSRCRNRKLDWSWAVDVVSDSPLSWLPVWPWMSHPTSQSLESIFIWKSEACVQMDWNLHLLRILADLC